MQDSRYTKRGSYPNNTSPGNGQHHCNYQQQRRPPNADGSKNGSIILLILAVICFLIAISAKASGLFLVAIALAIIGILTLFIAKDPNQPSFLDKVSSFSNQRRQAQYEQEMQEQLYRKQYSKNRECYDVIPGRQPGRITDSSNDFETLVRYYSGFSLQELQKFAKKYSVTAKSSSRRQEVADAEMHLKAIHVAASGRYAESFETPEEATIPKKIKIKNKEVIDAKEVTEDDAKFTVEDMKFEDDLQREDLLVKLDLFDAERKEEVEEKLKESKIVRISKEPERSEKTKKNEKL